MIYKGYKYVKKIEGDSFFRINKWLKQLNKVIIDAWTLVHLINYVYLCSRKSKYCAGLTANNTLIKSDLTFN
jgi:hypothetical protein